MVKAESGSTAKSHYHASEAMYVRSKAVKVTVAAEEGGNGAIALVGVGVA